jgi:hypothetical protein
MKATLFAALVAVSAASGALAQEKYKYSFKAPDGVTKYTKQHTLDVGDVPGHQIRVAETHTVYTGDAPVYAGVKVKEAWGRLTSDYVDGSGHAVNYAVAVMENGDKVFSRTQLLLQSSTGADGVRKNAFTTVTTITGGTGKFVGIRGSLRGQGATDFKTGTSNNLTEGEYWFEK